MVNTKTYLVQQRPDGNVKSIPLHATTPEMWQSWRDGVGVVDDGDLAKLLKRVPWLQRGIDARANAIANLPFAFAKGDDELSEGELPPLPFVVEFDHLLNVIEGWLTLYGAAYLFKGLNAVRIPKELRVMHPKTITPEFDKTVGLKGFKRRLPGSGEELTLSPDDLAYVWLPSRTAEVGPGDAPALAALSAAGLLRSADEFGTLYFENGVIAPTLVTVPAGTPDAEKKRLETWAQRAVTGLKKAFNVVGIAADVKVSSLGQQIPLGSLALPEMTDKKREDIATALGVPQSMLAANAANFATAQQDKLNFYDETIIPEARRIEAALNRQVFGPLGWTLKFKPERLEMYQRLEVEKADKLAGLYEKDIYTREEVREEMGKDAVPSVGKFKSDTRTESAIAIAQSRPAPVFPPQPNQPPQLPPGQSAEQKAVADELVKWERKALKRIEEGKPEKAREFESDTLPWAVKVWVVAALEEARTAEDVKLAFVGVNAWEGYP
jgi:HK97 family phage portal protein